MRPLKYATLFAELNTLCSQAGRVVPKNTNKVQAMNKLNQFQFKQLKN